MLEPYIPSLELLLAFFSAAAIFAYMPGPSTLYAAAQTIAGGRRAGLQAAWGIHIGGYVHLLAAASGLALLFELVPILYTGLKLGGAAYLVWLGISMWRSSTAATGKTEPHNLSSGTDSQTPSSDRLPASRSIDANNKNTLKRSIVVEVLNPKTAIFYLAFLPQFTDPTLMMPVWGQLLVLGTIVNVMFSSADLLCVYGATRIVHWLGTASGKSKLLQRLGGTVLIGLGINLAASRTS